MEKDLKTAEQNIPEEKKLTSKCPLCKKPTDIKYRPFCSDRCKKVDLHRWIQGVYKVETDEEVDSVKSEDHEG
ncbi:MAG: DNA gyrase inhibitor YacG [Alphaproteobacteria bacterium]|nr:DNA gyrase inhibitor YacG [Alphaproteobacteria bacterium]